MPQIKLLIFLLTVLFSSSHASRIFTPDPMLIHLIKESPYIIIADVIDIKTEQKSVSSRGETNIAVLSVVKELKGDLNTKVINVEFPLKIALRCPAPARYQNNTRVIALLYQLEGSTRYETFGGHEGLKVPSSEGFQRYLERIIELQKILKMENKEDYNKALTEWIVRCAEHPETRSEISERITKIDIDSMKYVPNYSFSKDQIQRIRTAFIKDKYYRFVDYKIVEIIRRKDDTELIRSLFVKLNNLDIESSNNARVITQLLMDLSEDNFFKPYIAQLKKLDNYEDSQKRLELIQKLIKDYSESKRPSKT